MIAFKATVTTFLTMDVDIIFDSKTNTAPNNSEKSYYNELMSFFKTGVIPRLTHSQFGFDDLCYYATNVEIPTDEQLKALKNKLHLIVSLSFCEKKMEETLKEYANNPLMYRKALGEEFSWVKVPGDATYFPLKKKQNIRNFDKKTREILYEFDPLLNNI